MDPALREAYQVIQATAPQFFKGATDHTIRERPLLKMIQQSGNMVMNLRAPKYVWKIRVRQPKPKVIENGARTVWDETDAYETLEMGHAEVQVTDSMNRRDQMINASSPNQIIDIIGEKYDELVKSMSRMISEQFYADASSGTGVGQLTGLKSFMKPVGVATDQVAIPAPGTEYANLSIELASLGGWWSQDLAPTFPNASLGVDWPEGRGDSEYDFNTPTMLNMNATYNGDTGWNNNCLKMLRRMNSLIKRRCGSSTVPTAHMMGHSLMHEVKDKIELRERTYVTDYQKTLGFPDVLNYEGSMIFDDFECPAREGYSFNPSDITIFSVNDQLFYSDDSWETVEQKSLMMVGFLGNYAFTPRTMGAFVAL